MSKHVIPYKKLLSLYKMQSKQLAFLASFAQSQSVYFEKFKTDTLKKINNGISKPK